MKVICSGAGSGSGSGSGSGYGSGAGSGFGSITTIFTPSVGPSKINDVLFDPGVIFHLFKVADVAYIVFTLVDAWNTGVPTLDRAELPSNVTVSKSGQ